MVAIHAPPGRVAELGVLHSPLYHPLTYAPDLSVVTGRKEAAISGGHVDGRGERGCGWLGLGIPPDDG